MKEEETMDNCPHCGVSLLGEPIPEARRELFGGATHFKREIMVEVRGVYDGGLYFICPDCGHRYHRWPEGHWLRERARVYVEGDATKP